MAESLLAAAKRLSVAGLVAVGAATAVVAFLMAIMAPPLILGSAVVAVIFAIKLNRERDPSAPLMLALAAGCLIAATTYAALAIANAQFQNSGSGSQSVPLRVVTVG